MEQNLAFFLIKIGIFFSPSVDNTLVSKYASSLILKGFGLKVLLDKIKVNCLCSKLLLLKVGNVSSNSTCGNNTAIFSVKRICFKSLTIYKLEFVMQVERQ